MAGRALRASLVLCLAAGAAACTPTRAAAPPEPELATVQRAEPDDSTSTSASGVAPVATTGTTSLPPASAPPSIVPTVGAVDTPALTGWAAFDQSIRLDVLSNGASGASVAVAIDGEVLRSSGFGHRAIGTYERVDPADRFRIASISKIITAVVLLQLVDDGLVELDEPVGARLVEHLDAAPTDPHVLAITSEQLLSHTSGIPQYESTFFRGNAEPCPDAARWALGRRVDAPGGYRYSNMNYCLAGLLIESLTGRPYAEVVYTQLLTPLGITGMRLAGTYDVGPGEVTHFSAPGRAYMEALGAAGAWIASAADVVRVVDSLNPSSPGWRPLSDELLERMRRPPFDRPLVGAGYGLGLIVFEDGSFGHTGTLESTHAMVLSRPDGVTWALLVNGEYPSRSASIRGIVDRALAAGFPDG